MGNRFAALPGYHGLIRAHGAIAFILFLVVVPSAIFIMRFGKMYSTATLRIHVWLHIFTVFMLTVVLILGCYAVGPERSLTNPHHGIGVAIYTLVLVQFLGGYIVRRMERNRDGHDLSVKTMVSICPRIYACISLMLNSYTTGWAAPSHYSVWLKYRWG